MIYGSSDGELQKFEIGVISGNSDNIDEKIRAFATAFEQAVMTAVDGRKTRHIAFDWATPKVGQSRLGDIQKIGGAEVEVRFEIARLTPELVTGSEVLATTLSRDILQELSQARFAPERVILTQRSRRHDEVRVTLEELKKQIWLPSNIFLSVRNMVLLSRASQTQHNSGVLKLPPCFVRPVAVGSVRRHYRKVILSPI
jgi:hypothetical protein